MVAALYTTMYDEVLPDAPGIPQAVALNAIRNAVIEFCDRVQLLVADHSAVNIVADTATYAFAPAAGYVVCGIVSARFDGIEIDPTTQTDLTNEYTDWPTITGTPRRFLQESEESVRLFPIPTAALTGGLTMKVALKPTRASTGVEGWILEKYREEIAHGAKSKLFAMQKKPWSAPDLSAFHGAKFDDAIGSAKIHVAKGLGKARLRTTPRFF